MPAGIDSLTFSTPGAEPVTFSGDDFDRAVERITAPQQLSFDVGQNRSVKPAGASIAITGRATLHHQLLIDDDVRVQLVDAAGEVIGSFEATCVDVTFKKHDATETTDAWIERIHKLKIDANDD